MSFNESQIHIVMNNLVKSVFLLLSLFYSVSSYAQVGIQLNTNQATESYTLFETFFETFLVDNCGQIVNRWPDIRNTQLHSKLLPDGELIFIKDSRIERRAWNNSFRGWTRYNAPDIELVYEVIPMSNGHILSLGRQFISESEFVDLGYNLNTGRPDRVDVVLEIDPETDEIVWQWNIKDHVIQERDSTLANYGSIADNPNKLNMDAIATFDWTVGESFMINGFDYNEELDLIALSVRKISEVIIIDHSTTTEEARGDSGGYHNRGGDILFRWGNDQNYGMGNESDRKLYFQHNPNWIEYGEHKGKLIMFNNGLSARDYSSAEIIDPAVDEDGRFIAPGSGPFGLNEQTISINETTFGPSFLSGYTSGAKVLPNGNIFITEGQNSRLIEINPEGDMVWEYTVPQGGYIFRAEKYPIDYPAFDNRDLTPLGTVEEPSSNYDCELISTSVGDLEELSDIQIMRNQDFLFVKSLSGKDFTYYFIDSFGRLISKGKDNGNYEIKTSAVSSGAYFLRAEQNDKMLMKKILVTN